MILITSCAGTPPDPRPQFCAERGGRYERRYEHTIATGYCVFSDNSECETWSLYRGLCRPGQAPSSDGDAQKTKLQQVITDLEESGVKLVPVTSFWGGNGARLTASMPLSSHILFETSYERTPPELFQIRVVTDAQAFQSRIQSHIATFSQPRGFEIDAIRYYRCDTVFVAYIVSDKNSLNPMVNKALSDACGPAFAGYPSE